LFSKLKNYVVVRHFFDLHIFFWHLTLSRLNFVPTYYLRSELIWQDGFLFDFLQKKTTDIWVRKFVIYTGFLFSERLVFEAVIRLYIDNLIWFSHNKFTFESTNVSDMLNTLIFIIITVFFLVFNLAFLFF
jgi:hypothetical protein